VTSSDPGPPLAVTPTPLHDLPRLTALLRGPRVLVKRDDLTGLALGGNKARKLERLVADALERGCDTLVTGGGVQSNHVRQTAAAAAARGLDCHVVLAGREPDAPTGNVLLDHILGATLEHVPDDGHEALESEIAAASARLAAQGRHPYPIPIGGASLPGVLAYADAADELVAQATSAVDVVVVADGTGGTHAGLLAGFGDRGPRVVGVDVGARPELESAVEQMANEAARAAGRPPVTQPVEIDHEHAGPGYAQLDDPTRDALLLAARTEGLLLDPVYTAKAFAALVAGVRTGRFDGAATVVFWHTGGQPALFAGPYAPRLASRER
jgi:1-aminocyclopropane-1-carboxylate deaminase/D-cysteine desulfhydrase-like pyridoxal-dependent ACC family enzyme